LPTNWTQARKRRLPRKLATNENGRYPLKNSPRNGKRVYIRTYFPIQNFVPLVSTLIIYKKIKIAYELFYLNCQKDEDMPMV